VVETSPVCEDQDSPWGGKALGPARGGGEGQCRGQRKKAVHEWSSRVARVFHSEAALGKENGGWREKDTAAKKKGASVP